MGRNTWDTTPEEEIVVEVEAEVPAQVITDNLQRKIERLEEEQREDYMYTRELQIRNLRKEVKDRGETGG